MHYKQFENAEHIWIYGAGVYGRQAVELLTKDFLHLPVRGVVVSRKAGNHKKLGDYDIFELREVDTPNEGTVFVISASLAYQEEMITELKQAGYSNYVIWEPHGKRYLWNLAEYKFENRKRNKEKACFILSGYKEILWDDVFGRLKEFVPDDVDVCILSSGLYDDRLSKIAADNSWSYLSTEFNDLTMIQNIAITLFDRAEWIYKMDEDMFLTEGCFEKLFETWMDLEKTASYHVGIVAPLIPVNGYGYIRILEHIRKRDLYEQRFGRAYYGGNSKSMIENSVDAARFMWGYGGDMPQLDELNRLLAENRQHSYCNVRFSIGFILFGRKLWDDMDGFEVTGCKDLGVDEIQVCEYCMIQSLALAIAENTVVGHFSFGQQTAGMQEFYKEHPELFRINN